MPTAADRRALNALVANNIAALQRASAVIENLPDAVFTDRSEAAFSASVGEHFRHIIEHYQLFLDGCPDCMVDYNNRPRNAQLETDRASAQSCLQDLCRRLRVLSDDLDLSAPIQVRCSTGNEAMDEPPATSSPSRELVFLHNHSVHHFALIILLLRRHGITVDKNLGTAPSTRAY